MRYKEGDIVGSLRLVRRLQGYKWLCWCSSCNEEHTRFINNFKRICPIRKTKQERGDNYQYAISKRNAGKRGLGFSLTRGQYAAIVAKDCFYCGKKPKFRTYTTTKGQFIKYKSHGVDRVNNNKGYFLENSVSCCYQCNWSKNTETVNNFLAWVKRIYYNMKLDNTTGEKKI